MESKIVNDYEIQYKLSKLKYNVAKHSIVIIEAYFNKHKYYRIDSLGEKIFLFKYDDLLDNNCNLTISYEEIKKFNSLYELWSCAPVELTLELTKALKAIESIYNKNIDVFLQIYDEQYDKLVRLTCMSTKDVENNRPKSTQYLFK